jgi:hypothetical protein
MTTTNARLNAAQDRNAQIKVLAMQYALQNRRPEETMDDTIANAGKIFEFMREQPTSLELARNLPQN